MGIGFGGGLGSSVLKGEGLSGKGREGFASSREMETSENSVMLSEIKMENQEHSNIDLIYEYTKERVKDINDGINRKINALAGTLAFDGAVLKFTSDMPSESYYFSARILICLLLLISMVSCIAGLRPIKTNTILSPKNLLEPQMYRASSEEFKITIVSSWEKFIPSAQKVSDERGKCLDLAFVYSALALIAICISIGAPNS